MADLLFLSHRIPYPPDKGEKIRAFHILRHLARDHRVHVGCLIDDPEDWRHVADLRTFCADLACFPLHRRRRRLTALLAMRPGRPLTRDYFSHRGLARWVADKWAGGVRDVFVYSSAMAPYVMGRRGGRRILDMVDIDSEKWRAYAEASAWPGRWLYAREARTLLALERAAAAEFDHTFLVSAAECAHFALLAPDLGGRVTALANGVDLARFAPDLGLPNPYPEASPAIVFTGTMDYRPNQDAVIWFAKAVLPGVRAARPGGKAPVFYIVGARPGRGVRELARLPGVVVTGRVPDTRPYLAHAALVVAPLRIARGVQNKVLEAMAMARPVLATPAAFEGITAAPGRDLLVADGAPAMIAAAISVLAGRHPELGRAARAAMQRHYAWEETLAPLDTLFVPAPVKRGEVPA
ncbi:MAG: TIGR03087 family PEP-CTERM/XrtA system glycosyltransferase [Acidibrevibacterium sp.]|uniref:TIGR03087 family PEP-CTERM/XrtA system glycosyltransferase n=1 Tax=Acidibrevibacterium sp. TaxID=2606776 RepID=UPI003CFF53FB